MMVLVVLWIAPRAPAAEDILKLVPDSASGLVVINDPAAVDAKLQALAGEMQLPVPSPLAMLKGVYGITEGVDEKGTIALIVLPPEIEGGLPTPILLIPVTDYAKFLAPLKPRKPIDSELTKIEVGNFLARARHIGGYAALTDNENWEILAGTLKLAEKPSPALLSWRRWLTVNDVAGVLLQPGVKRLADKAQQRMEMMKSVLARAGEKAQAAAGVFAVYGGMIEAAKKEVVGFGVGVQLNKQHVHRIFSRTSLAPEGTWAAALAQAGASKENLLAGLPAGPFVVAGGAALSDAAWKAMMKSSTGMMKAMPEVYGLKEEQVNKLSKSAADMMKGVRSMSGVLELGKDGEPLFSQAIGMMRVDNAQAFLANYEKQGNLYSGLAKGAKSPLIQPAQFEKSEIGGTPALQVSKKTPPPPEGMAASPQARFTDFFFGPGGKVVTWLVPADEHTVVMGYVNKDRLQQTLAAMKEGKPDLAADEDVAKSVALLPASAVARAYLSPRGAISFVQRTGAMLTPAAGPAAPSKFSTLPDFPKTPPIAFAVTTAPNEVRTHLAIPAEVLRALGPYVGQVMAARASSRSTETP
jgi:hypothetical protein